MYAQSARDMRAAASFSAQLLCCLQGEDGINLRLRIAQRFMALACTILALVLSPLSLYRIFQINVRLVGGGLDDALLLLLASNPNRMRLQARALLG